MILNYFSFFFLNLKQTCCHMFNQNNNKFAGHAPLCAEYSKPKQLITIYSRDQDENKTVTSEEATVVPLCPVAKFSEDFVIDLVNDEKRLWRIPWIIMMICVLQLILFALSTQLVYELLLFDPALKRQYWRFLSYTLLHADLPHLLLNICLQCFVGLSLECEQGHWKVAFIYITGGISGSLATLILQPQLSLLGASASIYSLLMSHVPHLVKNFSQLPYRYFRIVALFVLWLSDAGFTGFHFLVNHNENPRICLDAHIAGGVVGLLLGFILYAKWDRRTSHTYWPVEKILLNV